MVEPTINIVFALFYFSQRYTEIETMYFYIALPQVKMRLQTAKMKIKYFSLYIEKKLKNLNSFISVVEILKLTIL